MWDWTDDECKGLWVDGRKWTGRGAVVVIICKSLYLP